MKAKGDTAATKQDDDAGDVKPEDNEVDEDDEEQSGRAFRSAYVGRGNVQAVRAARKRAGLSEGGIREGRPTPD